MIRTISTAGLILLTAFRLFGQSGSPVRPFEVASIRIHSGPLLRLEDISTSGPRFNGEGVSAFGLVLYAYNLKRYQVSMPPSWRSDTFFDIVAKAEDNRTPTKDEFRQMVQLLLADRFQLKVHRESRETPVYSLVVGKNGLKLKESAPDASAMGRLEVVGRNYQVTRPKATMDDVVFEITGSFVDRPVLNRTGLTGMYDLRLVYTPNLRSRASEPDPSDISIFTAVQEQLGLKLVPEKAMVEILVVEKVEKPSEN
jgi:uncharacterized protein (TIGR03435 family)